MRQLSMRHLAWDQSGPGALAIRSDQRQTTVDHIQISVVARLMNIYRGYLPYPIEVGRPDVKK